MDEITGMEIIDVKDPSEVAKKPTLEEAVSNHQRQLIQVAQELEKQLELTKKAYSDLQIQRIELRAQIALINELKQYSN